MHTEYECTILEIDRSSFEEKIIKLGAIKVGEFFQKRNTYDFKPAIPTKWIRLRTNGKKTTLTIKEIKDKNKIGGTEELEIEVSDFEDMDKILVELGYVHKNYQENKRTIYQLNDIEIAIDKWPLIPEYAEIEGKTEEVVDDFVKRLDTGCKVTNYDVTSIYKEIYGIDVLSIKDLKLDIDMNQ